MSNLNQFMKKIMIVPIYLLFMSTLFCSVLFDIGSAHAALFPENTFASSTLPGPTPPTAPEAPLKPQLSGKQESKPAPKEPAPQKKPLPATKPQPEKPPAKATEKAPKPAEKQQSSAGVLPKGEPDASTAKSPEATINDQKTAEMKKKNAFPIITKMVYFALFLTIGAGALYAYFQYVPQKPPIKKQTKNHPQPRQAAQPAELEIAAKIKNKSLLEQLIKYDMETYGELRSTLNYDHPFYVEQLIVKYGYGNKEKIHRAIQLYNQRRSQK